MPIKQLILLAVLMFSLSACGQSTRPADPSQTPSAVEQTLTTKPIDNPGLTASITPNPDTTPLGGGAYWVASMYREENGQFTVFIVQPLSDVAPETIFLSESGEIPDNLHWSFDGQYLFFTAHTGEDRLIQAFYLYDRVNEKLQRFDFQQLTGRQGVVVRVDWSPDTQTSQLGFTLCADLFKECTLWLADLAQGTTVQLKDQGEDWIWDMDGKAMVFEKEMMKAPVRFNLQTMTEVELPMPSPTQLVPSGQTIQNKGMWRIFGFFPNLGGYLISRVNPDETWDFLLIPESGSQETLLFQTPQGWNGELIQPPVLSPDGRQIGFNFFSGQEESTLVIGSMEHLPLQVPATPDPQRGLVLLWSPDSSIYATMVDPLSGIDSSSLGFYEAQTGSMLQVYKPPAPFKFYVLPGSREFGNIQRYYFYGFDSVWVP